MLRSEFKSSSLSNPTSPAVFVTVFCACCSYLLWKDRKKERQKEISLLMAVPVSRGSEYFALLSRTRRWLFYRLKYESSILFAMIYFEDCTFREGTESPFCTRRYNTYMLLSTKGKIVHFCTPRYNVKILLSAKGQCVRFCTQKFSAKFVLSLIVWRTRFCTPPI